jgi:hypothetical protein
MVSWLGARNASFWLLGHPFIIAPGIFSFAFEKRYVLKLTNYFLF